jgi:hypothetical protein
LLNFQLVKKACHENMVNMTWPEMAAHTWDVVVTGAKRPQMNELAQPIGPKEGLDFLLPLLVISGCVGVVSETLRGLGRVIGRALGLKSQRQSQRFAGT